MDTAYIKAEQNIRAFVFMKLHYFYITNAPASIRNSTIFGLIKFIVQALLLELTFAEIKLTKHVLVSSKE